MSPSQSQTQIRWLVCSETVFQSVSRFWREEVGEDGLLAERLSRGLLQHVPAEHLADRLADLLIAGESRAVLVFDEFDAQATQLLEALPASVTDALELRTVDWRASPVDAVMAMNSPDYVVSSGTVSQPQVATTEAANDMVWTSYRSEVPLAASTGAAEDDPVRLSVPTADGERWTLSRAPLLGESAWQLVFRVDAGSAPRYVGRRVLVEAEQRTFDLGRVQSDGAAMTRIEVPVDIAGAYVHLGDPAEPMDV